MEHELSVQLLEAVRRVGADGVVDLFHTLARMAFAQYGVGVTNNDHIRGLLAEQMLPLGVLPGSNCSHTAHNSVTGRRQPFVHPGWLQGLQCAGEPDDEEYEPTSTHSTPLKAAGANVVALNAPASPAYERPVTKVSKTRILELLLGGKRNMKLAYNPEMEDELVSVLCQALVARCDQDKDMVVFRGRSPTGVRYNFDPTAVDGLRSVIEGLTSPDKDRRGFPYRLESALKQFVRWNPKMFPEIAEGEPKYAPIKPAGLTSALDVLRAADGLQELPTEPEQWPHYTQQLFITIKQRVAAKASATRFQRLARA